MVEPDNSMHAAQKERRSQRVAAFQHDVVNVLQTHARVLTENIQRIQDLLQVDELNVPRALLLLDDRFQGQRGAAVSSSGIEEHEVDLAQRGSWSKAVT